MKITVTNHHCDSRDIPVLGAGRRVIKLPAFGSIEIDFASDAQVRAFADILAKKAPAAQMYETICIRNPVMTVELPAARDTDSTPEEPIAVDPVDEPVTEAEASPEKTDAPKVKIPKAKKRGRKI